LKRFHAEIAVLHDLSHTNTIRIQEFMQLESFIIIVMPFIEFEFDWSRPLRNHILDRRRGAGLWHFLEIIAWTLFKQLLSGVNYLHENQTIHRNLTLENLPYDNRRERIVIKGFKLAEVVPRFPKDATRPGNRFQSPKTFLLESSQMTRLPGKPVPGRRYINPYFTAPEVLASKVDPSYNLESIQVKGKVDVYSCGVILVSYLPTFAPFVTNFV
jgi:serine/threonine protein kinase